MADFSEQTESLRSRLSDAIDGLQRHTRVLESIEEEPQEYDEEDVEAYLDDLDDSLSSAELLESAEASLETLEETADAVEQEFLENVSVVVDGREIEGIELLYLEPAGDPDEAALLVESPKVNQIRGGTQLLTLEDGREFSFAVEETLVADVGEDKTGDLKLVLALNPI